MLMYLASWSASARKQKYFAGVGSATQYALSKALLQTHLKMAESRAVSPSFHLV